MSGVVSAQRRTSEPYCARDEIRHIIDQGAQAAAQTATSGTRQLDPGGAVVTEQSTQQAVLAVATRELDGLVYPEQQEALAEILAHVALSLELPAQIGTGRGDGGTPPIPLFSDCNHVVAPPDGLQVFTEGAAGLAGIEALLQANDTPESLKRILRAMRETLLDAYMFTADVRIAETKPWSEGPDPETTFVAGLAEREHGGVASAMEHARDAWLEALAGLPPDRPLVGSPPHVNILTPADRIRLPLTNFVWPNPCPSQPGSGDPYAAVEVTGTVTDPTVGTVGTGDVSVTVNGVRAEVTNASYSAAGEEAVRLRPGLNAVVATAVDPDSNVRRAIIAVRVDDAMRPGLAIESGNAQHATIGTTLPEPLVVRVLDDCGGPDAGVPVVFRVVRGSGLLEGGKRSRVIETDVAGLASTGLTIGSRAGAGSDQVRAIAVERPGEVVFTANASAGQPTQIHPAGGEAQKGGVNEVLPDPLTVVVFDAGGDPVADVPVTFEVTEGGGEVEFTDAQEQVQTGATVVVPTDADGRASVRFNLGSMAGLDNNRVSAGFPGLESEKASFAASSFELGPEELTRVEGIILDGQSEPVPGVTVRIHGTDLVTTSDEQGQFRLADVPVRRIHLQIDATTATRPGAWASLEFEMPILAGIVNTLEKPVYILPLDVASAQTANEAGDVTVITPDVPGFSLLVRAGSATFADGSKTGLVHVTPVHADKVPMRPGAGMQPRMIVTIQPPGVHFDPPAQVTFPNVDGLPPGTVTEMFSFDHDLGMFVSIGTGTVAEDGTTVRSDPGFGVVKGGWHCSAPTSPSGASAALSLRIMSNGVDVTGKELFVCEGGTVPLSAVGEPADGTAFGWMVVDESVASLAISGSATCTAIPGQPLAISGCANHNVCESMAIIAHPGQGQARNTAVSATMRCCTTDANAVATVRLHAAQVRIRDLTFSGDGIHTVVEDEREYEAGDIQPPRLGSARPYLGPHWLDNNGNGTAEERSIDGLERTFPVCFERGSVMHLAATFQSCSVASGTAQVRGVSTALGGIEFVSSLVGIADGQITVGDLVAKSTLDHLVKALPAAIGVLDPLAIEWSVRVNGGDYMPAGVTRNRVYVTLGTPLLPVDRLYESLLDIACRNNPGFLTATPSEVVDNVWLPFEQRIPINRKQFDGYNYRDGRKLRYWSDDGLPEQFVLGSVEALLSSTLRPAGDGVGSCGAWAQLLKFTLQSVGISDVHVAQILPDAGDPRQVGANWGLINNWQFPLSGTSGSVTFPYTFMELRDLRGVPGQGTEDPRSGFLDHALVFYRSESTDPWTIFDPSYGKKYYDVKDWELDALAALCRNAGAVTLGDCKRPDSDPEAGYQTVIGSFQ